MLALTLVALLPGLVAFTVHYLVLRGFYALQDTRTPFFVQLSVSGTMVTSALLIAAFSPPRATILLAVGYSVAYIVGASVSIGSLGRRLEGLRRWPLVLHILTLAVPAGLAALLAYGLATLLDDLFTGLPGWLTTCSPSPLVEPLVSLRSSGSLIWRGSRRFAKPSQWPDGGWAGRRLAWTRGVAGLTVRNPVRERESRE